MPATCKSFVRKFCAKVLCESFDRKFWAVFFLEPDSESRSAGLGWAGLGWAGLAGLGWAGLGWAGLGGLGWAGLGWAGLGWAGLGWAGSLVLKARKAVALEAESHAGYYEGAKNYGGRPTCRSPKMGLAHSGLQILGLAQPRICPLIKTGAVGGFAVSKLRRCQPCLQNVCHHCITDN